MKLLIFFNLSVLTYVLGAQKNHLIETVLLSTHNIIMFWLRSMKINFCYTLSTKHLGPVLMERGTHCFLVQVSWTLASERLYMISQESVRGFQNKFALDIGPIWETF